MYLKLSATVLGALALVGCFSGESSPTAQSEKAVEESQPAPRYGAGSWIVASYWERQTNNGAAVERFADCPEGMLLTGFGGRVYSDNFTGVTVHCRGVDPVTGVLTGESSYQVGSGGEESVALLDSGYVAISVGGWVNNGNLRRVEIKGCPWNPSTRKVSQSGCFVKSSDGLSGSELTLDAWSNPWTPGQPTYADQPRTVLSGAGMTSSSNNVAAVRVTVATLIP